ncbi:hypothetical protein [Schlesneria paludicola]|uniref:hypothetical protein n=1 Tax=Schlesneria paludicola TaxID=360056 RepID=UPI00029B3236|nr:hypothetical protein [Schlesneria paludicola]
MYFRAVQTLDALLLASIYTLALAAYMFGSPPANGGELGHAQVGPHKGTLIELGEEEYHAEFVLDEKTHTVSIYLLDGAAKNYVPIPAREITVTLKHDGKTEAFKLKAKAQKTDPPGLSSMYTRKDEELVHDLHRKGSDPRLMLKIDDKPYLAKIQLSHQGHDHKHEPKSTK